MNNNKITAVNPCIFRAYDIRGIVNEQISEDIFYTIGQAISVRLKELKRYKTFIARDARLSSESLANALQDGLIDGGIDVLNLGEATTPILYFATHTKAVDSGLMVTGSHNPANYNGIKIVLAGKTLVETDLKLLYQIIANGICTNSQKGKLENYNIIDEYVDLIVNDIKLERQLKIVVDCGNGVAGPVALAVFKKLGVDLIPLYCEVDGNFPNHHPDPSVEENLKDLKSIILEMKADLGIAFDGDADRLGVVDNNLSVIWPDRLLMLFAQNVLKNNSNQTIVYDVKCSSNLAMVINEAGGIGKMCPTGHSIVKAFLKKEKAALAGELSGHIFFQDRWYGFDDALYSACRLLEILSQSIESVSEQFAKIPNSINTPEIKIPISEDKKFTFMNAFTQQAEFPEGRTILMDGIRVEFEHGWGLIRASNTTPCLVARFEAKDLQNLKKIQNLFRKQITNIDTSLDFDF